ncbi:FeoC-like transcriptional regulator [Candidatus Oscillochloris fontis]|uniref:FeoC-like transcriptional regulator n=1 Tax=Candidatus Oscillochloris fontis TaxID=2496868 RepID=UPI00101C8CDE|nr:FeoC-like transcriptional regulator [Candidatus Oscillochloris fontis]
MLHQVLDAFEQSQGPVSLDELSRQLGIERSALDGMIAFWVRKGRLIESGGQTVCASAGSSCTCSAYPGGCVFSSATPRRISASKK